MRYLIWFLFATVALILSCTITVKHKIEDDININVNIGIDENCLVCQASCDSTGALTCDSPAGDIDCSMCTAGCLAGVGAMCMEDGSLFCFTRVSGIELEVPAICVQAGFIAGQ